MASDHFLFDSIFNYTHPELQNIQDQMKELQTIYQSNELSSISIPYNQGESLLIEPIVIEPISIELESIVNESESIIDEPILNDEQIHKFKQIYTNNKIEDIDDDNEDNSIQKMKKELDKKDEEAQFKKLQTVICCKEHCLQNLILHENAVSVYQKIQKLSNDQKDMFMLGVLSATARNETITSNQKRQKLASSYVFEGIKICNKAFLTIYGIGEKYWNNIRSHFTQKGISPRIHKLTGKVSNFALSFDKILEILTFIVNFANINGLPSPGI